MKNLLGKIINLGALVGLVITTLLMVIFFFLGFAMKVSFIGDFSNIVTDAKELYFIIPLVLFWISIVLLIALVVFDIYNLALNRNGKMPTVFSLFTLAVVVVSTIFSIYLRIGVQGLEHPGINYIYVIVIGSVTVFFIMLILVGNLLNVKQLSR